MPETKFKLGDRVQRKTTWKREVGVIDQARPSGNGYLYHVRFSNVAMWCVPEDLVLVTETIDAEAHK